MNEIIDKSALSGYSTEDLLIFQNAFNIALKTLRNRYTKIGILAGKTHFSDIWLRDSCFASWGSLSVGDIDIVKTNLLTIIKFMRKNGQIPLRIGQKHFLLKLLGIKGKMQARFIEDKGVSLPADGASLFLITVNKYIEATNDLEFLGNNFAHFKKAIEWNFSLDVDQDLLMEEGPYAGWTDSLKKQGKVLYSNVLHYKAVDSYVNLCALIKEKAEEKKYAKLRDQIKEKMHEVFWNGSYFIDWIHRHRHNYFSTDGNILAIIFGLVNKHQAQKIQNCLREFDLDHTFITQTNYPKYEFKHVFFPFLTIKLADYHNGLQWLWIGCMDVIAKKASGNIDEALELLLRISKKITEYKGVYEVYHDGKPVRRLFYHSEQGFAWSSGIFLWACKELGVIKD